MADSEFSFDNAEPEDGMDFQGAIDTASNDDDDDDTYMDEDAHKGDDDEFKLDDYDDLGSGADEADEDDNYDSGDDEDRIVSKKRKRSHTATAEPALNPSKKTDMRIKAEGGESFMLDDKLSHTDTQKRSRVVGTFGRRERQNLPAYHKKVTAELDSDDELMLKMREDGYSDRQIADKLGNDGRVRYDQKSISTRIMRIRLAQADRFDFLLREGYKEWGLEDDQRLVQAYALADIEISYEIERIRAWRFRKVSEYMRRLNTTSLFSATACRVRYGELMSGTARMPCDLDDDPDARREERELFRLSREAEREKEAAEEEIRIAMEKRKKDSVKIENAQRAEETANKRAAAEAVKAQNAMKRAAEAQLRLQKAAENQKAKSERNAQIKKTATNPKKRGQKKTTTEVVAGSSKQAAKKTKDEADAVDPRSYLNMTDIAKLCAKRGLPTDKSKKALIASLIDADTEWSHDQLRKMCKAKGLNAGANKAVMRYQLALKAAQACPSFEAGRKAEEDKRKGEEEMAADDE